MKNLKGIFGWSSMKQRRWVLRESMTKSEEILWKKLRKKRFLGLRFRRQHGIGPYVVDFYHAQSMTVIEVDGSIHYKPEIMEKDRMRQEFLESLGYKVIRFSNHMVFDHLEFVLQKIKSYVVS